MRLEIISIRLPSSSKTQTEQEEREIIINPQRDAVQSHEFEGEITFASHPVMSGHNISRNSQPFFGMQIFQLLTLDWKKI